MTKIAEIAFACCFGLGLGCLLGYQLHEQTTPQAEVANLVNNDTTRIKRIEEWQGQIQREYTKKQIMVITPVAIGMVIRCVGIKCEAAHYVSTGTKCGAWIPNYGEKYAILPN